MMSNADPNTPKDYSPVAPNFSPGTPTYSPDATPQYSGTGSDQGFSPSGGAITGTPMPEYSPSSPSEQGSPDDRSMKRE